MRSFGIDLFLPKFHGDSSRLLHGSVVYSFMLLSDKLFHNMFVLQFA